MKTALVLGAGGFIGSHMVKRLRDEGFGLGVDLKYPEYSKTEANEFIKRFEGCRFGTRYSKNS